MIKFMLFMSFGALVGLLVWAGTCAAAYGLPPAEMSDLLKLVITLAYPMMMMGLAIGGLLARFTFL